MDVALTNNNDNELNHVLLTRQDISIRKTISTAIVHVALSVVLKLKI